MTHPRFLFVVGAGRGANAHPMWPGIHQDFEGDVDADGSWVSWRLTSANHRELGRSCRVFRDLEHAWHDVGRVLDRIDDAEATITPVPHAGTWGWRLSIDDAAVATSSRGYSRPRECRSSLAAFVAASAIADRLDCYAAVPSYLAFNTRQPSAPRRADERRPTDDRCH